MFDTIKKLVAEKFEEMKKLGTLLRTGTDREKIWDTYLSAFDENLKQEHNCNCCKAFIRQIGNVVVIHGGHLISVWDLDMDHVPEIYKVPVAALSEYVKSAKIEGLFMVDEPEVGKNENFSQKHSCVFRHFYVSVPKSAYATKTKFDSGELESTTNLILRAAREINDEAIGIVLDLIAQGSLYRGKEYQHIVEGLDKMRKELNNPNLSPKELEIMTWNLALTQPIQISRGKNTAIGTLLVNLSEGMELEKAVKAYETITAPYNYKRPTALVTPRMIEDARKTLSDLGLLGALERRRLDSRDLGPHNALYVHRGLESTKDVFAELKEDTIVKPQTFSKCEEVTIDKFIQDILPKCKSIRALVENEHLPNFVTLTGASNTEEKPIFKWSNSFGWSYSGGVADSMKQKVVERGGRVDGVLRFTHQWNWDDSKPNRSLMDLHVVLPGGKFDPSIGNHSNKTENRIGWNRRKDPKTEGVQDVDYIEAAPPGYSPVENITFPSMDKLPDGEYVFAINNWSFRAPTKSGFKAEIDLNGKTYQYQYDKPLQNKEWAIVARAYLKNGKFTIEHQIEPFSGVQAKWGVQTNTWRNVKAITVSPNHWDKPIGNKHWFFILEGCVSDEKTRPFYNEFLCDELSANRKVMEVLANKITVADAEGAELSGLGFSETVRNHVLLEVEGSFKRVIKVIF